MDIEQINKAFPTHKDCIKYLENVRWNGQPTCPYCNSRYQSPLKKENRYHCNNCNTSFSVTVDTPFHKSKVRLQKWFLAISLLYDAKKKVSSRQLSRELEVHRNTAWYMTMRIRNAMLNDRELLMCIVEIDDNFQEKA